MVALQGTGLSQLDDGEGLGRPGGEELLQCGGAGGRPGDGRAQGVGVQAVKRDHGQGLLRPGQGPVDDHVDDAGDLGLHRLDRGLPGRRHAPPVQELQGQGGVPRWGGHGLDDPLVAVGREEGGDAGVEAVTGRR